MGKVTMNLGGGRYDAEIKALRQTLLEMQEKLQSKEAELAKTRHDLAESNHRIGNNLQLVSTFLRMQASSTPHEPLKNGLYVAIARVAAITRLHMQFRKQSSVSRLDFGAYIAALAEDLRASLGVSCVVYADPISLEERLAVDLAIAVNELVINAAKYGCGSDGTSDIEITCCHSRNNLYIAVRDHGPGISGGFDKISKASLGLSFVRTIVAHHKGELLVENNGGARLTMLIPRP